MRLEGRCYCGAVRYVAEGEPVLRAQCHCRAWRQSSRTVRGTLVGCAHNAFRAHHHETSQPGGKHQAGLSFR